MMSRFQLSMLWVLAGLSCMQIFFAATPRLQGSRALLLDPAPIPTVGEGRTRWFQELEQRIRAAADRRKVTEADQLAQRAVALIEPQAGACLANYREVFRTWGAQRADAPLEEDPWIQPWDGVSVDGVTVLIPQDGSIVKQYPIPGYTQIIGEFRFGLAARNSSPDSASEGERITQAFYQPSPQFPVAYINIPVRQGRERAVCTYQFVRDPEQGWLPRTFGLILKNAEWEYSRSFMF